jgi:RND family efflux transporter MFP subunit
MNSLDQNPNQQTDRNLKGQMTFQQREKKFRSTAHFSYYAIGAVILIVGSSFLTGVIPRLDHSKKINAEAAQTPLPVVTILEVKANNQPIALVLPSSLDAINITPLWARVDGYIRAFLADIGDFVKAGDVLAEIETPELDQQYEQAIANLTSVKAKRNIAKITADRWMNLFRKNPEAIAKQEVDQRAADLEATEADVLFAHANVRRLQHMIDFKRITAPFDGIIIERSIDLGSLITAGSAGRPQQLFKIARTDVLRVFVEVPQRFFRSIKNGVVADVDISEFPEKTFKGFVARYAKALDPIARTLLTEVHILNPNDELFVGLYADVKFLLKPDNAYYVIPTNAVIIRADGPKVALLDENDIVHLRDVTLGLDHGKMMEITSGLQENDRVITNPSDKITENAKVKVIK